MSESALRSAHLEGTDLWNAHLEGATLRAAHLGGLSAVEMHGEQNISGLRAANLRYVYFSLATTLDDIDLGNEQGGYAHLVDVRWGGVNLTNVNWKQVKMLGNEQKARRKKRWDDNVKDRKTRLEEHGSRV